MTSELRQGGFNRVEPRFLPEEWEVMRSGAEGGRNIADEKLNNILEKRGFE
ncbi:MAG: hypothetical protein ACT6FD_06485 [Methanosarcinaceae archaeon]